MTMERDGMWEVHTLAIKDAVLEDAGEYEIMASNRAGNRAWVKPWSRRVHALR